MKNHNALVFLVILLCQLPVVNAQKQKHSFKPGDWFECEMEFEEGVPVFRNHMLRQGDEFKNTQLISIRFTCTAREEGESDKWKYKILRYKHIAPAHKQSSYRNVENVYDFDTWYPDYFMEDIDSIRKVLTGTVSIDGESIIHHDFKYKSVRFSLRNFLPFKLPDDENDPRYVSTSISYGSNLWRYVEKVAEIIFETKDFQPGDHKTLKWFKIDSVRALKERQKSFVIHDTIWDHKNSCTAYYLSNGLPYAFMDQHQHKVFAITNASFPVPTMAKVKIVDKRTKASQKSNRFDDVIQIRSGNPAFIMHESVIPGMIQLDSSITVKTYALKCGTAFNFFPGNGPSFRLFIVPGDIIQVTLKDDRADIIGSDNSKWWNENSHLDDDVVDKAPIDEEFKAYLRLSMLLKSRYYAMDKLDTDSFKTSILDFFVLKSYHYKYTGGPGLDNVITHYNSRKDYLINATGSPTKSGFDFKYYKNIIQNTGFPLYFELYNTLTGQYSYTHIDKDKAKYETFIKTCGDTLFIKDINEKLKGYDAFRVGQTLPFQHVLTENKQKINILPAKGKYGLLFLYRVTHKVDDFNKLGDSIPGKVQTVSYRVNHDQIKFSDKLLPETQLGEADHLELYAHPTQTETFDHYTIESLRPMLILYDDKGQIILNDAFEKQYGDDNYIGSFKTKILEAIEHFEKQSKNNNADLWLLIALSVVVTGLLVMLIYKIRINRLKKRNAQQQLLQELKLKSVQSQLNPHFIFNALNSIQQLINSAQPEQANTYLIGFSNLLRGVLKNADKKLVSLSDELEMLRRYTELEQVRLNFKFRIDVDTGVSVDLTEVPYMLFQPLIENSIKHGISKIPDEGEIRVEIEEIESDIVIRILDNGPGFGRLTLDQLTKKGKGLVLIQEKIDNIYGNEGRLELSSGESGKGAAVIIKLKIG